MTATELTIFAASVAVLLFMPGPTNALMMTSGALVGIRRSMPLISLEIAGYLLAIMPLLALDELAGGFRQELSLLLKSFAALVTITTAARLWLNAGPHTSASASPTALGVFLQTLFNPKALIFAFAIIPPVPGLASLIAKTATFTALVFVAASFWITVGSASSRVPILPKYGVVRVSSIVLAGYAVYFAISVVFLSA